MAALALALRLGRPETFVKGFEPRYITLAVPAFCCIYFAYELYAPRRIRWLACAALLAMSGAALWPDTTFGITYATEVRSKLAAFERDLAAGTPSYLLIHRYGRYLHPHPEVPNDYMPMLRRAGVGCFVLLRDNPPFHEVCLPLVPQALNYLGWQAGTAQVRDRSSYLVFDFAERYVCGIRLKYSYANPRGVPPSVVVYWKSAGQEDFLDGQCRKHSPTGDQAIWDRVTWVRPAEPETTLTLWICDRVAQVRIHPDRKPGTFTISEIVLLVPADASFASLPAAVPDTQSMSSSVSASGSVNAGTVVFRVQAGTPSSLGGPYPCPRRWHVPQSRRSQRDSTAGIGRAAVDPTLARTDRPPL
jgi:hypothetical protein